jgi:hypothetical protein
MLRFLPFYFTVCFVGEPNSEASAIFKLKSLCCEPSYFILVVLYTSVESVLGIRNYLFPSWIVSVQARIRTQTIINTDFQIKGLYKILPF